jgi:hypothetical protein
MIENLEFLKEYGIEGFLKEEEAKVALPRVRWSGMLS